MSERKLYPINKELSATRPQAAKYAQIHGMWGLIPEPWNDANLGRYKNTEEVYRDCVRKGVTWKELLNYSPNKEIIL